MNNFFILIIVALLFLPVTVLAVATSPANCDSWPDEAEFCNDCRIMGCNECTGWEPGTKNCICKDCSDDNYKAGCYSEATCDDTCGSANQTCDWINDDCVCFDDPSSSPQTEDGCAAKCGGEGMYEWDDTKKLCVCTGRTIGPAWGDSGPQNIPEVIRNVIHWVLGIAGTLAVLFVIIGGIRYITSAGNQNMQESAKKTLFNAIIGIIIVTVSFVVVNMIFRVIGGA